MSFSISSRVQLVALQLRGRHDDAVRVAHADDRRLLDAVLLVEVVRGDRMTGLVVRDGALVVRGHAEDRLLDAEEARVARGEPVLVGEVLAAGIVRDDERLVDDGLDVDRRPADGVGDHQLDRDLRLVRLEAQVVLDDVPPAFAVWLVHHQLPVETAGTDERGVEHLGPVRRADHEHDRLRRHGAADEAEPARDLVLEAVLDVLTEGVHLVEHRVQGQTAAAHHAHRAHHSLLLAAHRPATRQPDRVELVEEEDAAAGLPWRRVLASETARLAEERDDDERVDAHPHARQARRVDVDERQVRLRGHAAREERLACTGRTREEHAGGHLTAALPGTSLRPSGSERGSSRARAGRAVLGSSRTRGRSAGCPASPCRCAAAT